MYTDSGRGLASEYLRQKRSQTKANQSLKPIPSVSILEEPDSGAPWRPPGPSFTDTLQLSLGKRVVENGDLTVKIIQLERNAVRQSADYEAKCRQIEALEANFTGQKRELTQSQAHAEDLKEILQQANARLDQLESKTSLSDNEKSQNELEKSAAEKELTERCSCSQLQAEVIRVQEECEEKIARQQADYELAIQNIRYAQMGKLSFHREANNYHEAGEIAALQAERNELRNGVDALRRNFSEYQAEQLADRRIKEEKDHEVVEGLRQEAEKSAQLAKLHFERADVLRIELASVQITLEASNAQTEKVRKEMVQMQDAVKQQETQHHRETESWQQKFADISARSTTTLNETLNDLERRLRESELKRSQLAKDFAEQIAQSKGCKDMMQGEYQKKITELASQFEEDYRRRTRLAEEQAGKAVQEWKAEYEKAQIAHQQYIKMVDLRLEEHSRTIKDRHLTETAELNDQITSFALIEKTRQAEMLILQQENASKKIDLKAANSAIAGLQKKIPAFEARLKELTDSNEKLAGEIVNLKQAKDPETIVQMTLQSERSKMQDSTEREYEQRAAAAECLSKAKFQEQLEEQRTRLEKITSRLTEQLKTITDEAARERGENQRHWVEFAEKKRMLEEKLANISGQTAAELKSAEVKHQTELKTLKENQDKLIRKMKAEKNTSVKKTEETYKAELRALEVKQKNDSSLLLRQHQEDQRDLLASVGKSIQTNVSREYVQQIQRLQLQIGDYVRKQMETETSFKGVWAKTQTEHQQAIQTLETQVRQSSDNCLTSQKSVVELQCALEKVKSQHNALREKVSTEVNAMLVKKETEYRQDVARAAETARQDAASKLELYQKTSKDHMEKLQRQLEDFQTDIRQSRQAEERVKRQLGSVLERNQELEKSQTFIQKRLRQSEERLFDGPPALPSHFRLVSSTASLMS